MIGRFVHWIGWIIQRLTTLADNRTPTLRKVLAFGVGTIGLAMGIAFIGLSIWSVAKGNPFDALAFGSGAALLLSPLTALPWSLGKAMQIVTDETEPPQ